MDGIHTRDRSLAVDGPVRLARWLVHNNLLISLSATSWVLITVTLVGLPVDPVPLAIVFVATMFVYSLNRVTDLETDARNVPDRAAFTRRFGRPLLVVATLAYLGAVAVALVADLPGAPFLLAPLVVAAAYTYFLQDVLLVKNLVVGLAWGAIPLGVGVYYDALGTVGVWVLVAHATVTLTVAAAIFDIKDIEGDRAAGTSTVPTRYGVAATRRLAQVCNLAVAAAVVALVAVRVLDPSYLTLLVYHAYVGAYIPFATRERGPLFYGFVVDAEHLVLAVAVVLVDVLA